MSERRSWSAPMEIRQRGSNPPRLEGYAVVWNALSKPLGRTGIREQFTAYAFGSPDGELRTINGDGDVLATIEHDPGRLLGRRRSGTLDVRQDDHGLFVSIDTPRTREAEDLIEQVRRGDVSEMSFTFEVLDEPPGERFETRGGQTVRTVFAARLAEVTATAIPAYDDTQLALAARSWLKAQTDAATRARRLRLAEVDAQTPAAALHTPAGAQTARAARGGTAT